METINVKVVNKSSNYLPLYASDFESGADICSNEDLEIKPGETRIVKTGIFVAIPNGYEIQVRPRSGLSAKTKLRIANSPGTIDSSYRGEIGIIMENIGSPQDGTSTIIKKGDRIAQFVLNKVEPIEWIECTTLNSTDRGLTGFGDSGIK
jgi:dUTP pyrophosphatase